jgi:sulfoxide reductase catalytic subunit YedY
MSFFDPHILPSDITPQAVFENRRALIKAAAAGSFGMALAPWFSRQALAASPEKLAATLNAAYSSKDELTPYKYVTGYNNFYEFGTDKSDPAAYAASLQTRPWAVSIEGLVKKPVTLDIDALLKLAPMEERVYRMRCVEGWSMVIPWDGYSLSKLINKVK